MARVGHEPPGTSLSDWLGTSWWNWSEVGGRESLPLRWIFGRRRLRTPLHPPFKATLIYKRALAAS